MQSGYVTPYIWNKTDPIRQGPVREGMKAVRGRYLREARVFTKENSSAKRLETWALACYQVTYMKVYVDALNHSRRGSAAVSDDGSEDEEEVRGG